MNNLEQTKPVSANGKEGHLIYCGDGQFRFRVYNGDLFTDYDILHCDLHVRIMDEDAYFYKDKYLDHSPETLGVQL